MSWSLANAPKKPVRAGASFVLRLSAQIQTGWHLYSLDEDAGGPISTDISLADNPAFELGLVKGPKPIKLFDPNFGRRLGFYLDKAEFAVPVQVLSPGPVASQTVVVQVHYQSCNDKMCLPPKTATVEASIRIQPTE